ncbi:DedA family protein [uncultured Phenylobacterium sp.]|uniref:DedA family protein n=1 Tax=uncultured Phenylobacterium sp. TaxID=349273 RepID=UPI0025F642CA|nr:DedA family protein [uncultured Phenylobacterium sp.]
MAELEHYLAAFGPVAILVGAGIEGMTAAIAGGVLARKGLIPVYLVVGAAALGSTLFVQVLHFLGRSSRGIGFVRRMKARSAFGKALALIERHPTVFVLSFRFLFGLRAVAPVAVGMSDLGAVRFAILNAIGAVIWAAVFVAVGYVFGPAVLHALERAMAHAPVAIVAVVVAIAAGLGIWRWRVWKTAAGAAK